jgi:hypothetical protein
MCDVMSNKPPTRPALPTLGIMRQLMLCVMARATTGTHPTSTRQKGPAAALNWKSHVNDVSSSCSQSSRQVHHQTVCAVNQAPCAVCPQEVGEACGCLSWGCVRI